MPEWDLIAEYIKNAMQAVEETHKAGAELEIDPDLRKWDALRAQMSELQDHLQKLQMVLNNEEAYAVDELVDALSRAFSGHASDYRRTPRMMEEK
jgi:hypothetical protein